MKTIRDLVPPCKSECPVIYESDQQRCTRCRAVWDAGDFEKCARPSKPTLRVISRPLRNTGRSRYWYVIRWPGGTITRSTGNWSMQASAYSWGMRRICTWLAKKKAR